VTLKHKVRQLDVAVTRQNIVTIVKPAISNAAERAPSVLNRMAARGPRYRVGLVSSATSRRWDFSDEPGSWCTQAFDISGLHSTQEILDHAVGRRLVAPISVSQAGEHLCVACDHGLGDSHLDKLLVARALSRALSSVALEQRPEPISEAGATCR
jgi:hypothetical protein